MQVGATDFLFQAAAMPTSSGPEPTSVAVVAIDDQSLADLGKMSEWPRSYYAVVTRSLKDAGASVIAYDLLFAEEAEGDEEFAAAIALAGNVVLSEVETTLLAGTGGDLSTGALSVFESATSALATAAAENAHANAFPDSDGVIRRVPAAIPSQDGMVPALGVAAAALHRGADETFLSADSLVCDGTMVPVDSTRSMIVNYARVSGDFTPSTVSFADVLRGNCDLSFLRDKVVFIGATAVGLQDAYWSPSGRLTSGVAIHAAVAETIISGNPLRRSGALPVAFVCLGMALLAWLLASRFGTGRAVLGLGVSLAVYAGVVFAAFDNGLLLDMFYAPGTLVATFATVSVYSSTTERMRRRKLASTFGRFVSAPVAAQIMAAIETGALSLGGSQRHASVLFADMRGFTPLAAKTEPHELIRIVNAYLKVAVEAVNDEGGVVNKFGGDSIMAVWNAPTDCPNHTLRAVRAGLAMQRRVELLAQVDPSLPSLRFGVGINCGEVVAGTLGAEERLEYSVIGDAVNVAARVTAITDGGSVWITESAMEALPEGCEMRDLGYHSLKGKDQPLRLFEVAAVAEECPTQGTAGQHTRDMSRRDNSKDKPSHGPCGRRLAPVAMTRQQ